MCLWILYQIFFLDVSTLKLMTIWICFPTINFSYQHPPEALAYLEPSRISAMKLFREFFFFCCCCKIHKKTSVPESLFNKVIGFYPTTSLKERTPIQVVRKHRHTQNKNLMNIYIKSSYPPFTIKKIISLLLLLIFSLLSMTYRKRDLKQCKPNEDLPTTENYFSPSVWKK